MVLDLTVENILLRREIDEDISRLKTVAVNLLSDLGCNGSILAEDLIYEICRFGAAELHVVAAFIGGIASQEVIKVYTLVNYNFFVLLILFRFSSSMTLRVGQSLNLFCVFLKFGIWPLVSQTCVSSYNNQRTHEKRNLSQFVWSLL